MICIFNLTQLGNVAGWILARNTKDAARRADRGGKPELARILRSTKTLRGPDCIIVDGIFWTMIAGEPGR
jgi:hypothetical protein